MCVDANMNRKSFPLLCQLILLLLLLSGCQIPVNQSETLLKETAILSVTVPFASAVVPATTSEPSATQKPFTPTPTQAITPTSEVISTLSEIQQAQVVIDMLGNNGGCELPCWWSFVPGETSAETISGYFSSIGVPLRSYVSAAGKSVQWVNLNITQENFHMGISFSLDDNVVKVISISTHVAQGDYYIFNDLSYNQFMERFTLTSILSTLGQPTEVLVTAVLGSTGGTVADYEIILFYPDKGVMVNYHGLREENTDFYRLCPTETLIDLSLWSPSENVKIADIYLIGVSKAWMEERQSYLESFLPLKDATGIDVNSFYLMFRNNVEKTCLDTSAHLWRK